MHSTGPETPIITHGMMHSTGPETPIITHKSNGVKPFHTDPGSWIRDVFCTQHRCCKTHLKSPFGAIFYKGSEVNICYLLAKDLLVSNGHAPRHVLEDSGLHEIALALKAVWRGRPTLPCACSAIRKSHTKTKTKIRAVQQCTHTIRSKHSKIAKAGYRVPQTRSVELCT